MYVLTLVDLDFNLCLLLSGYVFKTFLSFSKWYLYFLISTSLFGSFT